MARIKIILPLENKISHLDMYSYIFHFSLCFCSCLLHEYIITFLLKHVLEHLYVASSFLEIILGIIGALPRNNTLVEKKE